jgi:hypothetical protein
MRVDPNTTVPVPFDVIFSTCLCNSSLESNNDRILGFRT